MEAQLRTAFTVLQKQLQALTCRTCQRRRVDVTAALRLMLASCSCCCGMPAHTAAATSDSCRLLRCPRWRSTLHGRKGHKTVRPFVGDRVNQLWFTKPQQKHNMKMHCAQHLCRMNLVAP
jgi:hypothetical protein